MSAVYMVQHCSRQHTRPAVACDGDPRRQGALAGLTLFLLGEAIRKTVFVRGEAEEGALSASLGNETRYGIGTSMRERLRYPAPVCASIEPPSHLGMNMESSGKRKR